MKRLCCLFTVLLISCGASDQKDNDNTSNSIESNSEMALINHVKLAISPNYEDWVLFSNGTYIIFENADTIPDINAEAISLMKEYGSVHAGSPAGDFSVIQLIHTEGWIVSGHCYGMYTYVNPSELEAKTPSDMEIGLYGRAKREKDGINPSIIHINRKK